MNSFIILFCFYFILFIIFFIIFFLFRFFFDFFLFRFDLKIALIRSLEKPHQIQQIWTATQRNLRVCLMKMTTSGQICRQLMTWSHIRLTPLHLTRKIYQQHQQKVAWTIRQKCSFFYFLFIFLPMLIFHR